MSVRHLAYFLFLSVFAAGCAANMSINDKVIATVGDRQITYGEFKSQYSQNALPSNDSTDSILNKENFLNLLVDYHLKLLDAEKEKLREEPAIKAEMNDYERQLAVGYILEHEITDPMVRKIYERRKFEVRAQQVFIQIKPDSAFPAGDTLKAYDEALGVIKALEAGASLDSLIRVYRGGDTYYITAGNYLQYVGGEQFEDMLYSLKPGEVGSSPVRTAYGYLVVKLMEKRPRYESVRASHILIRIDGNTPSDTLKAYDKAVAILDSAKAGVDFAKLAMDNSADTVSAKRGGDLGYFQRGMMVRPFDEAVFNMKVGEVAGPVRTQFGYHIIKLTDIKPVPPFAEAEAAIRAKYLDGGYKYDLQRFVDELRLKYNYKINDRGLALFTGKVDSTKTFAQTDFDSLLTPAELEDTLFTFDNEAGTIDTVVSIIRLGGKYTSLNMNSANIGEIIDQAADDLVLAHYAMRKARTYAEFDSLIRRYEDGILIYEIEQNHVWRKIVTSDSVLKPYFLSHAGKYNWPRRVDLSRIDVKSVSLADSIYGMLEKGTSFDSLASEFQTQKLKEKDGHWGLFADSANALATTAFTMKEGEFSRPQYFEGGYSIIRVDRFVAPEPKTFEEARGEVSSDYQEYESKRLESQWLESLRKEFKVKIDQKIFHELLAKD